MSNRSHLVHQTRKRLALARYERRLAEDKKNSPRKRAKNPVEASLLRKIAHLENRIQSLLASREKLDFYDSAPWQQLRYEVLKRSNGCCELCGASKHTGAIIQVDHIKPRSKFPQLELDPGNLQVLCRPCNMGKSNTDQIDWRTPALRVVQR